MMHHRVCIDYTRTLEDLSKKDEIITGPANHYHLAAVEVMIIILLMDANI